MIQTYHQGKIALTSKGQKIVAALFLVTGHLPEHDALREKLRVLAVGLVDCTYVDVAGHCNTIISLLEAAQLAGVVSEPNAKIISAELKYFSDPTYRNDTLVTGLFPTATVDKGHLLDKRTSVSDMSFTLKQSKDSVFEQGPRHSDFNKEKKDKRQEKILSYITARKSASIKDIAALFPDVSEKTIQRELTSLVASGKINKRGNKRWSLYLAI